MPGQEVRVFPSDNIHNFDTDRAHCFSYCSTGGICGYGPSHCGKGNCTSNCDAKAMCGRYSENGEVKCGMNLCCSYYGWCGVSGARRSPVTAHRHSNYEQTDEAHCTGTPDVPCQSGIGNCEIKTPRLCGTRSGTTNGRTVAYYQGANVHSRVCDQVRPGDIDTSKYTHLYYAFASIDPKTFAVQAANPGDNGLYKEFTVLRSKGVKTWIAVGGFDFSDPVTPTATTWSDLVSTDQNRAAFITSLMSFMDLHGFQGISLIPPPPRPPSELHPTPSHVPIFNNMLIRPALPRSRP